LLLLLIGAGFAVTRVLWASLPRDPVWLTASGTESSIWLSRDTVGVPSIRADSDGDAHFAIGYAHAQDRLWQLELERRTLRGEMSELFGEANLGRDIWFRSLDLHRAARDAWPALSEDARSSLQRYVDGINAVIDRKDPLPIEFRLLGIRPQHWTVFDSLARLKSFAFEMSGNFRLDLVRETARTSLTTPQLRTLFPDDPLTGLDIAGPERAAPLHDGSGAIPWGSHASSGCSAWAVSGAHTTQKAGLLASDCHEELQVPSPWYVVHAKGDRLDVTGMSLVGTPLVLSGHNARVSWAATNLPADTQDICFENTDMADSSRYQAGGGWRAFDVREAKISVRAATSNPIFGVRQRVLDVRLRSTRNGPVISDQFGGFDRPFSLRWIGFAPDDTSYEALYRLQFAANPQELRAALTAHVTPALEIVYADADGSIGVVAAGRAPARKPGSGSVGLACWDDESASPASIPLEQAIAIGDPTPGYILAGGPSSPARAARIRERLGKLVEGHDVGATDLQSIQGDLVDLDAAALAAELSRISPASEEQAAALNSLSGWDGMMSTGSEAAAIFQVWTRQLRVRLLERGMRAYWNQPQRAAFLSALESQMDSRALLRALGECDTVWRPDSTWTTAGGCADLLRSTLQTSLAELRGITGSSSIAGWRWGGVSRIEYAMPPVSILPQLDRLLVDRAVEVGSQNTINIAAGSFTHNDGFSQRVGASFRQVIGLKQGTATYAFTSSTGQSGNFASPHYADLATAFARDEYLLLSQEKPR
jgi:penicillin amidase